MPSDTKRQQHRVLLAAVAARQSDTYADLRAQSGWAASQTALKETGLHSSNGSGPHLMILKRPWCTRGNPAVVVSIV